MHYGYTFPSCNDVRQSCNLHCICDTYQMPMHCSTMCITSYHYNVGLGVGLLQCIKANCAGILAVGLTGLPLDCSKLPNYGLLQLAPLNKPLPSVAPTPPSLKGFVRDHQGTSTDPKIGFTGNRTHHVRNVVIEPSRAINAPKDVTTLAWSLDGSWVQWACCVSETVSP